MLHILCVNWIWQLGQQHDQTMQTEVCHLLSNLMNLGWYWEFVLKKCRVEDNNILNFAQA